MERVTYYTTYVTHLHRSPVIDSLLADLDCHPLSVNLLARAARENGWDESRLLREWKDGEMSMIKIANWGLPSDWSSLLQ
jgi:hypothetical protein